MMENHPETLTSFCGECDAPPGACTHSGMRYLGSIVYSTITTSDGTFGYIVPNHERDRWDHPMLGVPPRKVTPDTRPLPELVTQLEQWADISGPLEVLLREQYEADPSKVTRLAHYTIELAKKGVLRNPGGLLMTRLRDMSAVG